MVPISQLQGKVASINGKFFNYTRSELEVVLLGHGFSKFANRPSKDHYCFLCADEEGPKGKAARDLGVRVLDEAGLRDLLGPPLANFAERLRHGFDVEMQGVLIDEKYSMHAWVQTAAVTRQVVSGDADKAEKDRKRPKVGTKYLTGNLTMGPPCAPSTLARIEERIGFPLPEDALNLFTQVNGISLFWSSKTSPVLESFPIDWGKATHQDGDFWRELERRKPTFGLAVIPTVETIFFEKWEGTFFYRPSPPDSIQFGKRKIDSDEFFANLFLLDAFHPFFQTALFADKKTRRLWAVLGQDYGADWESWAPVPFEVYMEGLVSELGRFRYFTRRGKPFSRKSRLQNRANG